MRLKLRGSLIRGLFEPRRFRRRPADLSIRFTAESQQGLPELRAPEIAPVQLVGIAGVDRIRWSSPRLAKELAGLVLGGYERSPWGGVEVGGVLFGTKEPNGVRIHAYLSLESEHKYGPSFELSERDEEGLSRLLADARKDPNLKGLVPVGWYHSVSNHEFRLTEHDLKVHDDFFHEPWQVAVVLKRSPKDPLALGMFLRQDNGAMATHPEYAYTLDDLRRHSKVENPETSVWHTRFDARRHHQSDSPARPQKASYRGGGFPTRLTTRLRYQ